MPSLSDVVRQLIPLYDDTPEPRTSDPFELILWENVAYLANDERRALAMDQLQEIVGLRPEQILGATPQQLAEIGRLGILPEDSAAKLRRSAEIVMRGFGGSLEPVLDLPVREAKRALRRFPGIGEPGAEKILLLTRRYAFLAPDSNGLRVLVRLGFCPANQSYARTYGAAREVAHKELGDDIDRLISARHALRRHGQTTCRNRNPRCAECILRPVCPFPTERDA